jgi:hypothetical protein
MTPRLTVQPDVSGRTLLDGAWWPRSTDAAAELPGLVLAIDGLHGNVKRLMLNVRDWDTRPRRLTVEGRVLRIGYFASQPANLLTAVTARGDRVDLLVVPPSTDSGDAAAAMALAAEPGNQVHSDQILHIVHGISTVPDDTSEAEGGQLAAAVAH